MFVTITAVEEDDTPILSMLFDHHGNRLAYQSPKQGHLGFVQLKERN